MQQNIRITSHVTIVLTLLTALTALLLAGFMWLASTKVDDIALTRQKGYVEQGLDEQVKAVQHELESVTTWNDAVLLVSKGAHQWIVDNIGTWMHTYFNHDRTYLFNERDELVFAMRDGQDIAALTFSEDEKPVAALRDNVRAELNKRIAPGDSAPPVIGGIFSEQILAISGRPAVVSARPIVPSTDAVSVDPGKEFIAIAVKFLDAGAVAKIARYARIETLHFTTDSAEASAAIPVRATDGSTLGYMAWQPVRPGMMLIEQIAPVGVAGIAVAMGVVIFLGRGLRKTSIDLSESRLALMRHRDQLEESVRLRTAEIERQREELDRLLAQERHVNALQRQFVTMASHEFRTPLAIIDAAAQRLSRTKATQKPEYVEEKAAQIRSAVLRMVDLMESILSAGRLETGKTTLKPERLSLAELIETCCARQADIRKSHTFHKDLSHLPQTILADRATIEQVFTNLLSNAIKYAPKAPDIHIRSWTKNGMSYVSIKDDGIGMDAEDLPKLFQPYYRARSATGIAGTGIGLNIVKQIIDLHGGSISVESALGRGTTFTVALPNKGPLANIIKRAA
ncbi:signal transduction histidine kinase [Neorhizobium sp. 2083]|uniref:sensor histidine kinase n=1 Tax=Neorhizobium sp. 2083 TaxID=2817762 RepID=UPI00285D2BD4|nr:ATP-binding protein [Neorhizobium sp. 2083]MDR6817782.1 signal transduction histidine kinase [Neorhizobium sp. 2083]